MSSDHVLVTQNLRFLRAGGNPFAPRIQLVEERGRSTNYYLSAYNYHIVLILYGLHFLREQVQTA